MSSVTDRTVWTHRLWPIRWRPLLDIWVDVYFVQVRTALFRENINFDSIEYLALQVTTVHKWGFKIRLYDTGIRRMER